MRNRWLTTFVALTGFLTVAAEADFPAFPICNRSTVQWRPVIDGHTVVWQEHHQGQHPDGVDIHGADLTVLDAAKGTVTINCFPICTKPAGQQWPAICGDFVAWVDHRDAGWIWNIYGADISDRDNITEYPICLNPQSQFDPAVCGDIVAWPDNRGGLTDIYGADISDRGNILEFPICVAVGSQSTVDVSGRFVVWEDLRNDDGGSNNPDIYGADVSDPQDIREFAICTDTGAQQSPSIDGNYVVWSDARGGIFGADISDLGNIVEFSICTHGKGVSAPAISGSVVVWPDNRNGTWDVYGYDLSYYDPGTGIAGPNGEFRIHTGDGHMGSEYRLDISGNIVVWMEGDDIYGTIIPEPAILSVLALGGLVVVQRRKRR